MFRATKRAGWWIPIGLTASLVVGRGQDHGAARRGCRDRRGVLALRQLGDPEVVRPDRRAQRRGRGVRGVPVVLRVLRRAPHRARAAVAALLASAAAALRLSRPRADREPDGAREPRSAPDQPARGVHAGPGGQRGDGHRDPGGAVHVEREADAAVDHHVPVARGRGGVVPAAAQSRCGAPAGAARAGVGGRGGRRRRGAGREGPGRRAGGDAATRRPRGAGARRGGRAGQAAGHVQPDARPAADDRAGDGALRRRQGRDRRRADGRRPRRLQRAAAAAGVPTAHDVVRRRAGGAGIRVGGAGAGSDGGRARDRRRRVVAAAAAGAGSGVVLGCALRVSRRPRRARRLRPRARGR